MKTDVIFRLSEAQVGSLVLFRNWQGLCKTEIITDESKLYWTVSGMRFRKDTGVGSGPLMIGGRGDMADVDYISRTRHIIASAVERCTDADVLRQVATIVGVNK
jgi:hypothetical protein